MEYKKEYEPLYNACKKLKKASQVKGLSMGPPLGNMPAGVTKEIAIEFTTVFFAAITEELSKDEEYKKAKKGKKYKKQYKMAKKLMEKVRAKVMGEEKEEKKSEPKLKSGDHVTVVKEGSHTGETCVISEVNWNGTGRLQVKMDGSNEVKSYLPEEVQIIKDKKKKKEEEKKPEDSELDRLKAKRKKGESELSYLKSKGISFNEQYALRVAYDMMCDGKKVLTKDAIGKFFSQFHFELTEHDLGFLMGRLCELEDCSELPDGATFAQFALFAKRLIYSNTNGSLSNAFQILTGMCCSSLLSNRAYKVNNTQQNTQVSERRRRVRIPKKLNSQQSKLLLL